MVGREELGGTASVIAETARERVFQSIGRMNAGPNGMGDVSTASTGSVSRCQLPEFPHGDP